jgi:hypothetical protein
VDKTISYLRQIFSLLHQEQERDWNPQRRAWQEKARESSVSSSALRVQEELSSSGWWPISAEELQEFLSCEEDGLHVNFCEEQKYLYLPALKENDKDFVPILSLKANLDEHRQEFRLRVMLVCQSEEGVLYGIGFRLEGPEGDAAIDVGGEGHHDFYHAQLIKGFGKQQPGIPIKTPEWLPCSQPSFPLLANDPLTLVICLLLTLYGKKHFWTFYQRHYRSLNVLHETIEERIGSWIDWSGLS